MADLFPHHCGRLDHHDPHTWPSRPLGANWPKRTYQCHGHVLIEGGWFGADQAADAAEDALDRQNRDDLADQGATS